MYQKTILIGRLGRDPEMRFTPNGQAVTILSVATDRQWTGEGGQQVKETLWFQVRAWGKLAETCNNYLQKGKLVMIEGRLTGDPKTGSPRLWKGADDLVHASYEIKADTVKFLSPNNQEDRQVEYVDEDPTANTDNTDDIPF